MRPLDTINAPAAAFNTPGELWNDNGVTQTSFSYLQQILDTSSAPTSVVAVSTTDDDSIPVEVQRRPITGNYSAVRALRVLHQHRIDFWGASGVISTSVSSSKADPSQSQIKDSYDKFKLFSYLPPALTPTLEEYGDLMSPSKRPTLVTNALRYSGVTSRPVAGSLQRPTVASLQPFVPFATNLSQFCSRL